jgi:hypothetical protein
MNYKFADRGRVAAPKEDKKPSAARRLVSKVVGGIGKGVKGVGSGIKGAYKTMQTPGATKGHIKGLAAKLDERQKKQGLSIADSTGKSKSTGYGKRYLQARGKSHAGLGERLGKIKDEGVGSFGAMGKTLGAYTRHGTIPGAGAGALAGAGAGYGASKLIKKLRGGKENKTLKRLLMGGGAVAGGIGGAYMGPRAKAMAQAIRKGKE